MGPAISLCAGTAAAARRVECCSFGRGSPHSRPVAALEADAAVRCRTRIARSTRRRRALQTFTARPSPLLEASPWVRCNTVSPPARSSRTRPDRSGTPRAPRQIRLLGRAGRRSSRSRGARCGGHSRGSRGDGVARRSRLARVHRGVREPRHSAREILVHGSPYRRIAVRRCAGSKGRAHRRSRVVCVGLGARTVFPLVLRLGTGTTEAAASRPRFISGCERWSSGEPRRDCHAGYNRLSVAQGA